MKTVQIIAAAVVIATISGCSWSPPKQNTNNSHRYDMGYDPYGRYTKEIQERDQQIERLATQLTVLQRMLEQVIQDRNNIQYSQVNHQPATNTGRHTPVSQPINRETVKLPMNEHPEYRPYEDAPPVPTSRAIRVEHTPVERPQENSQRVSRLEQTETMQQDLYRALGHREEGKLVKVAAHPQPQATPSREVVAARAEPEPAPRQQTTLVDEPMEFFDVLLRAEGSDHLERLNAFLTEHGVKDKFKAHRSGTYTIFLGTYSKVEFADTRRRQIARITGITPTIVRRTPGSV